MTKKIQTVNEQRHKRMEEIFHQLVDQSEDDTQKMLDELCGDDTELRSDVEQLLAVNDARLGEFMNLPIVSMPRADGISGYTILEAIGEGGMGTVYLAEQQNPRRRVALKTLKSGFASSEVRRRFEYEARILGHLQHPGIAQIFEAGSVIARNAAGWEFEQPYFAMELINGCSLTDYAEKNGLSTNDKLRLLVEVCLAVHSAHQQGVIHRDLKPGNILVNENGKPKILDFGVARIVDGDPTRHAMSTQMGQLIGTLEYMSPDQLTGDPAQVDTRSDVYSLGVILYELLVGSSPREIGQCSLPDAIHRIQHQPAIRISVFDSKLRGDIETIVDKSLEKDKTRRYQSAFELAADINRYLHHRPIEARPASVLYQLKKFARRNLGFVTAAGVVLITLAAAGVLVASFAIKQSEALDEAQRQILITNAVNAFINEDLLAKANSNSGLKKDATIRSALDAASDKIGGRFEGMPQVEAAIRLTIGRSYFGIGEFDAAESHLNKSYQLYSRELGSDAEKLLEVSNQLAQTYLQVWKLDRADELCQENIRKAETSLGKDHWMTAKCHSTYAILLKKRGRFADAESHYRRAIALWDLYGHEDLAQRNIIQNNLGLVLRDQKKYDESEAVLRDVVKQWELIVGRRHPSTAFGLNTLGDNLWTQSKRRDLAEKVRIEKFDEAAAVFGEALDIRLEFLGELHPETARSMYAMALIHKGRNELEEAEALFLKTLDLRRKIFETDSHYDVLITINGVGTTRNMLGKHAAAAEMFELAFATALPMLKSDHYSTKMFLSNLLHTYKTFLHDDVAIQSLLDRFGEQLTLASQVSIRSALAETLAGNSKWAEAIEVQRIVCDQLTGAQESTSDLAQAYHRLASYCNDSHNFESAADAAAKSLQLYQIAFPAGSVNEGVVLALQAEIRLSLNQVEAALEDIVRAIHLGRANMKPENPNLVHSHLAWARALSAAGAAGLAEFTYGEVIATLADATPERTSALVDARREFADFLRLSDRIDEAEQQLLANLRVLNRSKTGQREWKHDFAESFMDLVEFYLVTDQAERIILAGLTYQTFDDGFLIE